MDALQRTRLAGLGLGIVGLVGIATTIVVYSQPPGFPILFASVTVIGVAILTGRVWIQVAGYAVLALVAGFIGIGRLVFTSGLDLLGIVLVALAVVAGWRVVQFLRAVSA